MAETGLSNYDVRRLAVEDNENFSNDVELRNDNYTPFDDHVNTRFSSF